MKILESIQEFLSNFGVTASQSIQKHPFNAKNVGCLIWYILIIISIFACLVKEAESIKEYMNIVNSLITVNIMFIESALHVWKMRKIFTFIVNFDNLIQKRLVNPKSKLLYEKCNQQVEEWTKKLIFAMLNISVKLVMWPMFFVSFITYFTTDAGKDAFQLPLFYWFPFDWKNIFGYLIAFGIKYLTSINVVSVIVCQSCLMIGSCWFLISLAKDISRELLKVNKTKIDRVRIKRDLINFIQLESDSRRIVSNFLDAYEFNITTHFLWTTLTICSLLLMLQIELSEPYVKADALIPIVCQIVWTFVLIFIYCKLGQRVSESFNGPYDEICQFKVHLFPLEIKRVLPIIILSAQQPVELRGYGNISCSRDRFKSVVNGGFTYFMMLRAK